jgi:Transposase DDE domain
MAEVDDREPVEQMVRNLWGHLYGDHGYISKVLHDTLLVGGLKLITFDSAQHEAAPDAAMGPADAKKQRDNRADKRPIKEDQPD